MLVEAVKYERLLKASGQGVWGRIEYNDEYGIVLRSAYAKQMRGTVRVYFDGKREQVVSGRLFEPLGEGRPLWFREGTFYRLYTHIEFVKPIPKGVSALVVLQPEMCDLMMISSTPMRAGYKGNVNFVVNPMRPIEMEKMISMATLMFFSDYSEKPKVKSRTKKEKNNEDILRNKHTDDSES